MEECAKGGVGLCSVEGTLGPKAAPGDFLKAVRLECGLEGWGGPGRGVGEKRKESDAQGRGAQRVEVGGPGSVGNFRFRWALNHLCGSSPGTAHGCSSTA